MSFELLARVGGQALHAQQLSRRACLLPAGLSPRAAPQEVCRCALNTAVGANRGAPPAAAATRRTGPPSAPDPPTRLAGHGLVGTLPFSEDDYVEVGLVAGAHGVRGELRLEVSTDQPARRFKAGSRLYLMPPSSSAQALAARAHLEALPLMVVTARGAKMRPLGKGLEAWMVALEEVTSRTQAEHLRGHVVYCAAADRDALRDPDEFYVTDIVGCTVVDQASRRMVGLVVDVFSGTGTHDTLRVKLRANEQDILDSRIRYCMIPFAKAICPVLDLKSRTLEVAPPEGLLDLFSQEPLKKPLSDEAKAEKLKQLRDQLQREEEARQQQAASQAAAMGPSGSKSEGKDGEEEEEEEGGEEGEEEGGKAQASGSRSARGRRPGLRRGSGGVRLGRRRT